MKRKNIIIMGAAGRDFHDFNIYFRNNPFYDVKAFTATQIPDIADRKYPKELAGKLYPNGIPIYPEKRLSSLIKKFKVDKVVFAYSDVRHEYVMHRASVVLANGADFLLLGPQSTMLKSKKPVISVCAVRTGAGKSPTTRRIVDLLQTSGKKIVVIRHPMPYGNLKKQICQRFSYYKDLEMQNVTIEEREEYEPIIKKGAVVYAGVEYEKIVRQAEKEADIIIWDGGNNDFPFIQPDLHIVLVDPHRPGHEISYYPGEINLITADIIIINKINTAPKPGIKEVMKNIKCENPRAKVIKAYMELIVDKPALIKNKKVLVVEDGPTMTHGGMTYGAGSIISKKYNAKSIIDAKKYAVGSIKNIYKKYPHLKKILPAMGYNEMQIRELEVTINKAKCDIIIDGTPVNLSRLISINKPIVSVDYELKEIGNVLKNMLMRFR